MLTECGGIEVARTEERMEELRRRMASAKSWGIDGVSLVTPGRDQGARPVHRRERARRRLLLAGRGRRRLAARGHAHARGGAGARARSRSSANTEVLGIDVEGGRVTARAHRPRRRRGRVRRDRLRRVEPADRAHGRRVDPAHAGGAPDDRRRPGAALRGVEERDRVPDRARHGHEHVRAPGRQRPRGRLVRAPADPARPRRDPVDRGVGALPDRAAVHAGRLRPADGGRARADAGDPGRRVGGHQVRDQRPALAHARTACRSSARRPRCGGLWSAAAVWVKEGPGVGRALAEWMVEGEPEIDLQASDVARFYEHQKTRRARAGRAPPRASTRPTASSTRASSGSRARRVRLLAVLRARAARSARSSTRPPAGSARTGTSRTRRCSRSSRTRSATARPSGTRAGGRRSSTPSTWRCATAPRCST